MLGRRMRYTYRKTLEKGKLRWTDRVEDGVRQIYLRCPGCMTILRVGDESGSLNFVLTIDSTGYLNPCLICKECQAHGFVQLKGWVKKGWDIFDVSGEASRKR